MITAKASVRMTRLTPALLAIFNGLYRVDQRPLPGQPAELCITSLGDGEHMEGSQHYKGTAADLRSRTFQPGTIEPFRIYLETTLGSQFRVLFEGDHFHVQVRKGHVFDPATAPTLATHTRTSRT